MRRISDAPSAWHASSSAKVYPREVETVLPGAAALFAETPKLYLQVLEYVGAYRFQDDLLLELADLRPYAHKLESPSDFYDGTRATPFSGLSDDEIQDYCEANPSVLPCVWRAEAIKGSKQE